MQNTDLPLKNFMILLRDNLNDDLKLNMVHTSKLLTTFYKFDRNIDWKISSANVISPTSNASVAVD